MANRCGRGHEALVDLGRGRAGMDCRLGLRGEERDGIVGNCDMALQPSRSAPDHGKRTNVFADHAVREHDRMIADSYSGIYGRAASDPDIGFNDDRGRYNIGAVVVPE